VAERPLMPVTPTSSRPSLARRQHPQPGSRLHIEEEFSAGPVKASQKLTASLAPRSVLERAAAVLMVAAAAASGAAVFVAAAVWLAGPVVGLVVFLAVFVAGLLVVFLRR
jgi:hypothetical protein